MAWAWAWAWLVNPGLTVSGFCAAGNRPAAGEILAVGQIFIGLGMPDCSVNLVAGLSVSRIFASGGKVWVFPENPKIGVIPAHFAEVGEWAF